MRRVVATLGLPGHSVRPVLAVAVAVTVLGACGTSTTSGSPGSSGDVQGPGDGQSQEPTSDQLGEAFGTFTAVSKQGKGSAVVSLPKGAKAGIVTVTHTGSSNIAASVIDAQNKETGELLVNDIGSYAGTAAFGLMSMGGGEPAKIKVTADGSWTIKIAPVSSAPKLSANAKGKGDAVFTYTGPAADWAMTHDGSGNFAVTATDGSMPDLLVNEIGKYMGTVPMSGGPLVVAITADGSWTMKHG